MTKKFKQSVFIEAVVCNNTSVPTLIINHLNFPHRASTAFKITITLTHRLFTVISEFFCRYSICCRPISDLHLSCILFIFQYKHEEVKPILMKALVKSKQQGQRKKESIWNNFLTDTCYPSGQGWHITVCFSMCSCMLHYSVSCAL